MTATPLGLTAAEDGTYYYGIHRDVPAGWDYWLFDGGETRTRDNTVQGSSEFVRCAPSREKWTVAHNEVRGDDFVVVCYRLTEDTSAPAPEFARWVGGLMNEADK